MCMIGEYFCEYCGERYTTLRRYLDCTDSHETQYVYTIKWSAEDGEWVATVEQFPSLSWLSDTAVGALFGITGLVHQTAVELLAHE
jgi:hypothetical protein